MQLIALSMSYLGVGNDAQVVLKAVEADPGCAMPSAGVAIANRDNPYM